MISDWSWLYLAVLLFSLTGMTLIDYRYKICLFASPKKWVAALVASIVVFMAIDYLAIALGIFIAGDSEFATGIFLPGQMPMEEPLFLLLLAYVSAQLLVLFDRLGRSKD